jgi:acyl dehydratase
VLSSRALGGELPVLVEQVSVRRVLAYAAGIGDTSAAVFDDLGALVAPPSFCVALEWPAISQPATAELLGADLGERLRAVHASQDSHFHRAIRPGMRLETRATATALRATRSGVLVTLRAVTSDEQGPVVTSWLDTLYRGAALGGPDGECAAAPALPEPDTAGRGADRITSIAIPREMPHVYSECARIWNPIHTERAVARAAGLPDVILHGTATWALAGREIVARCAGGDPTRLRRLFGRFRAMVFPGTSIELRHRVTSEPGGAARVSFSVCNASGEQAIAGGLAEIAPA